MASAPPHGQKERTAHAAIVPRLFYIRGTGVSSVTPEECQAKLQGRMSYIRAWHNKYALNEWPGKAEAAPVVTQYPNLVAELLNGGGSLWTMADHAHVTPEIMAAALEDGEELTDAELSGLAQLICKPLGYLKAKAPAFVDPRTKKGKIRTWKLEQITRHISEVGYVMPSRIARNIHDVLANLRSGAPVFSASYANARLGAEGEIRNQRNAILNPVRSTRLGGAQGAEKRD